MKELSTYKWEKCLQTKFSCHLKPYNYFELNNEYSLDVGGVFQLKMGYNMKKTCF